MKKYQRPEPFGGRDEIERLVSEFESCTLPRDEWNHRAHLTVGLWYLASRPLKEATGLIRASIQKYNHACGIVTTKESGYHETITLFYVWAIGKFLAHADRDCTLAALANLLVNECGDRNLPLAYYSRERLMSWEARTRWVEPDLKPLD